MWNLSGYTALELPKLSKKLSLKRSGASWKQKFTCATCSSSYISESRRYFNNQDWGHITKDNKSHIC